MLPDWSILSKQVPGVANDTMPADIEHTALAVASTVITGVSPEVAVPVGV